MSQITKQHTYTPYTPLGYINDDLDNMLVQGNESDISLAPHATAAASHVTVGTKQNDTGHVVVVTMADATTSFAYLTMPIPRSWRNRAVNMKVIAYPDATGSGNFYLNLIVHPVTTAEVLATTTLVSGSTAVATSGTADKPFTGTLGSFTVPSTAQALGIRFSRFGSNVNDTCAGSMHFVSLYLEDQ